MKLKDTIRNKNITCPKCGKDKFVDFEFEPNAYSTYQIWCETKDCNTDLLIPTKAISKNLIVKEK